MLNFLVTAFIVTSVALAQERPSAHPPSSISQRPRFFQREYACAMAISDFAVEKLDFTLHRNREPLVAFTHPTDCQSYLISKSGHARVYQFSGNRAMITAPDEAFEPAYLRPGNGACQTLHRLESDFHNFYPTHKNDHINQKHFIPLEGQPAQMRETADIFIPLLESSLKKIPPAVGKLKAENAKKKLDDLQKACCQIDELGTTLDAIFNSEVVRQLKIQRKDCEYRSS